MVKRAFDPGARLGHPLFLTAVVTLALNDHVLKASHLAPVVSGKLSDVAGLLVAPLVLAWVLRARTRRSFALAHVAVGAGFALLQVPWIAEAANEFFRGLPLRVWPDPTDLLALPALVVSYGLLVRERAANRRLRARRTLGALALLTCTATGPAGSPPPRYPFPPAGRLQTDAFIRHTSSTDLAVQVRRVRDEVELECDALLDDPVATLRGVDYFDVQEWTLARGDAVPLWDRRGGAMTRECYAIRLVTRDREWYLAWRHGAPPMHEIEIRLEPDEAAEDDAIRIANEAGEPPRVPEGVVVRRVE